MVRIYSGVVWLFVAWAALYSGAAGAASWTLTGAMPEERSNHTATLLRDGKVLVTGGHNGHSVPLARAILYNPATGKWTATGSMPVAREYHTATRLANGKVLVVGGQNRNRVLADAILYDPATGQWTATQSMPFARYDHTATLLANGKVLVAAGGDNNSYFSSTLLYDPATASWTETGAITNPWGEQTATRLADGKVLMLGEGGRKFTLAIGARLYDPVTGVWTEVTESVSGIERGHTATLLANGRVLAVGGSSFEAFSSATLYDPVTGSWTATSAMPTPRSDHTATLLANGKVLVAGGWDHLMTIPGIPNPLKKAQLYNPVTGKWTATDEMSKTRRGHTATLLASGKVLVAGGSGKSAELYTPETGGPNAADFVVAAISLNPASPELNTPFTAQVTVKNQGKTAGNGGQLLVWANLNSHPICGMTSDQSVAIGSLAAGTSKTFTLTGLQTTRAGNNTLRALVDGHCGKLESNESNNQQTLSYRVRSEAEFVVSAIQLNPANPTANNPFTATVTVTNQGGVAGKAGYLEVWADQAKTQPCGSEGDAWVNIGALNAGASKAVTLSLPAGSSGGKTLRAFVDSWCGILEPIENNNQKTQRYTVP